MYNFYPKKLVQPPSCTPNILLTMRLTIMLIMIVIFQTRAASFAQEISLSETSTPLENVFHKISDQTGYDFLISTENLKRARPVTIFLQQEELETALQQIFASQPLSFVIQDKTIIVSAKEVAISEKKPTTSIKAIIIKGRVTDVNGAPLPGATIKVKGTTIAVSAGKDGEYEISVPSENSVLIISFIGYHPFEIAVSANKGQTLTVRLTQENNPLNQVQVIGYGSTTKRFNTGSVATLTAKEVSTQPVTNVLSAISGRLPGVFTQTTNGLPGGNINIQIRGKGSILAGTDPLYIVDGVPFPSSVVSPLSNIATSSIGGASSPLNSINPSDIESINVLKDADATSIYGSRGANGVVLITTKKGKAGQTKVDVNLSEGYSQAASLPQLLDLHQFLTLRREAFKNSGATPSVTNARDLLVWDTTRSTDWAKYYFGRTGHVTNLQAGLSGGNTNTSFNISTNYHRETTILPGTNHYSRGGLFTSLQHSSANKNFMLSFSASYNSDNNTLANVVNTVGLAILMPPNYPLYNPDGSLNWYIANPIAEAKATSVSKTDNLISNLSLKYQIATGLNFKVSSGFNKISVDHTEVFPTSSLYPGATNYTNFGLSASQSFIVEPQVSYDRDIGLGKLNALIGGTYQNNKTDDQLLIGTSFTNEGLMENISSAGTIQANNQSNAYKYISVFGRLTYNYSDRYILNGTLRRDGSSRFGPGDQFGTFGSVGAAWIFSNEDWVNKNLGWLSFGKFRASYGWTGNDQIPDYQYLSTYGSSSAYNYQNTAALQPTRIANANFHWETTRKLDMAAEIGFLHNRILITIERYLNKSDDQLVAYSIPYITGFNTYQANLPAVIRNSGWEISLSTQNIKSANFSWSTNINLTASKNILESFENFENSSYSQTLQLGYDITRIYGYKFNGVDPTTGKASYAAEPGSSSTSPYFYNTIGKQTPEFYGGIGNTFSYYNWQLEIFGQFSKQMAKGGFAYPPGIRFNSYSTYLDRWQKPGDNTNIPRASTINDPFFASSSANYFDASYFRIKNVALSYTVPNKFLKKIKIDQLKIYIQGQNLATFWNRRSALFDPESGALTNASKNIPPLKTYLAGIQLNF